MNKQIPKKNFSNVALQKIKSQLNLSNLPNDLKISTITITCNFDTIFNVGNIGRYMDLSSDKVVYIKYGDGPESIRSIVPQKKKSKKKKKTKRAFYNQTTVKIYSVYKTNKKPTNVKLFKNGAIQMTGCVSVENCVDVLTTLCNELKKVKAVLDTSMKKIIPKPFITNPNNVDILKVNGLKIRMINSNFNIGFNIDRELLYEIFLKKDVECTYEPCVHACVNIKYNYDTSNKVSIFAFESGAIIITGAKTEDQIVKAYNFITEKLVNNYKHIVKTDIEDLLGIENLRELNDLVK